MSKTKIDALLAEHLQSFIKIREHIHAHPELSFQEINTAKYISEKLTAFGITHTTGIAGTGIVAIIKGTNSEKHTIALRADMDALPILEKNEVAYASQNSGIMHACGHDVHSTCLLGTAYILQQLKEEFEGTVKLIFQPGEEKHPGGASIMIKEGVLENPKPDAIFGLHVYPHLPFGKVGFKEGQYMASADEVYITIKGKGGHAALPHQTIDPIIMASNVLLTLQQIISRYKNPLIPSVLSFGKIQGGNVGNVIPDEVRIEGTFRSMDETWRYKAQELIKKHTIEICKALGGDAIVEIPVGYPSLINDVTLTQKARQIAIDTMGADNVCELNQRMAAEDFSFYTHQVPGCFFRIGTSHNGSFEHPVHTPYFDIHPEAIGIGIKIFCNLVMQY